jgi:hypothetical protein
VVGIIPFSVVGMFPFWVVGMLRCTHEKEESHSQDRAIGLVGKTDLGARADCQTA